MAVRVQREDFDVSAAISTRESGTRREKLTKAVA